VSVTDTRGVDKDGDKKVPHSVVLGMSVPP